MKVKNPEDVQRQFMRTIDLVKNPKPFFMDIVGKPGDSREWTIRGSISRAFVTKIDPVDRSQWPPLQMKTLLNKEKVWGAKPTLIASGALFNSLMGGPGNVYIMEGKRLAYGTTLVYGGYHINGTKHMPRRRFMGFAKKQVVAIKTLWSEYVKQAWAGEKK